MNFSGKPVNRLIVDQYEKQKGRGTQGFGIFDRANATLRKTPKQRKILSYLNKKPSSEILFHHRMPTSTGVTTAGCHPYTTKDFFSKKNGGSGTQYILAHNGVLNNELILKKAHEEMGIKYASVHQDGRFNDSEALLWDMALYLEGRQEKLKASGTIAFICYALNEEKGDQLYFGHNTGNPLNIKLDDNSLFLSSIGEGDNVDSDTLFSMTLSDYVLMHRPLIIPRYTSYSNTNLPAKTPPIGFHQRAKEPQFDDDNTYQWDDKTQTMYIKNSNGEWVDADDEYQRYAAATAPKVEESEGAKIANKIAQHYTYQDDGTIELDDEALVEDVLKKRYSQGDQEINNLENCSPVLLLHESLKAKSRDSERLSDLEATYGHYLQYYSGNYQEAYNAATKDLEWLREEYAAHLDNGIDNKHLLYEVRVLEGVSDYMMMTDEWVDTTSVDKNFSTNKVDEKQTSLTTAIALEEIFREEEEEEDTPLTVEQIESFRAVVRLALSNNDGEAHE